MNYEFNTNASLLIYYLIIISIYTRLAYNNYYFIKH